MDSALQLYIQQAMLFLQSMTIAYSPIATMQNNNLIASGYDVDLADPTTFKYYLNLTGQYHPTDTIMTIISLDTQQQINFTVANLANNPKTAAVYVLGTPQYTALCNRYPTQVDIVKSIVYPVNDINNAINAQDFTILNFGNGFLEANEQDAILFDIKAFINYEIFRWYQTFLSYEDYFYPLFWAYFWQQLFMCIMASRIKYIKTSNVNSFHVWQYLISNNLGQFRNVLTTSQAQWLYRNLGYIKANKGKQSNLIVLANNLLSTAGIGLVGKTIYHTMIGSETSCQWVPIIASEPIQTNLANEVIIAPDQSIQEIETELVANNLDISDTADYVAIQSTIMANTRVNTLPTKLVEIQQLGLDKKYAQLLNNFMVDTIVDMINAELYTPLVVFNDPLTNIEVNLTGKQALIIYYYCLYKTIGITAVNLPDRYTPTCGYRRDISTIAVPTTMGYNGIIYQINSFFDFSQVTSRIVYPSSPISEGTDFANLIGTLFQVMIDNIRYSRVTADYLTLKALNYCYRSIIQKTPYTVTLDTQYTTYSTWLIDNNHNYQALINAYDNSTNPEQNYETLATTIMSQIIPLTNATVLKYVDNSDSLAAIYTQIKQLFVMLCSYNITFLDTQQLGSTWIPSEIMAMSDMGGLMSDTLNIDIDDYDITSGADKTMREDYKTEHLDSFLYKSTLQRLNDYIPEWIMEDISINDSKTKIGYDIKLKMYDKTTSETIMYKTGPGIFINTSN
jgi:hypothetical protein